MATVRSGEANVWWESAGEGTPVLLINGLGSPSSVWFRLVPLLSPHHRVLTFDNLGTGRTGVPPGPYTIAMLADAAAAVIRASGEPAVHVLGISLGGLIAQQLALEYPQLVVSLTLVSTHAGMGHATGDPEASAAIASAGSLAGDARYEFLAQFAHAPTTPAARIAEDSAVRAQLPTSEEGYQNQLLAARGFDRIDELQRLTLPTFVLHGAVDRMISVESGRKLADHIPGARLTVLPDCGHQLFTDQPAAGAEAVLDFLALVNAQTQPA